MLGNNAYLAAEIAQTLVGAGNLSITGTKKEYSSTRNLLRNIANVPDIFSVSIYIVIFGL